MALAETLVRVTCDKQHIERGQLTIHADRRDLLEILKDRYGTRATIVTSQVPPAHRHEAIGDPTLADAIYDHLLHNGHRFVVQGLSRRKEGTLDAQPDSQRRFASFTMTDFRVHDRTI